MYHGSTLELSRDGNHKRPTLLCVFDDLILLVEPPGDVPSIGLNVASQEANLAYLRDLVEYAVRQNPDLATGALNATTVSHITDPAGNRSQVETIPNDDIHAVRTFRGPGLGPLRRYGFEILTDPPNTRTQPLTFRGTRSEIVRLVNILRRPLGNRVRT